MRWLHFLGVSAKAVGSAVICILSILGSASGAAPANPPPPATTPAEPHLTGPAGRLDQLEITGLPVEKADALRRGLTNSSALQRLAAPSSADSTFRSAVDAAARQALLRAGYKDAQTAISRTGDHLTLNVTAGPPSISGTIQIAAPPELEVGALTAALTTQTEYSNRSVTFDGDNVVIALKETVEASASEAALWSPGQPAPFDALYRKKVEFTVARCIREQGFARGAVNCDFVADPPGTANLKLTISDLGPRLTLTQIDISRAGANSRDSILELLGLRLGQPIDLRRLQAAYDRLYRSGRFTRHTLILTPLQGNSAALTLDLEDVSDVPPLNVPLSESDQALLRFQAWAEGFGTVPTELSLEVKQSWVTLSTIVNSDAGVLARISGVHEERSFDGTILLTHQAVGFRAGGATADDATRYFAPLPAPAAVLIALALRPHLFSFQAGLNSNNDRVLPPLALRVLLSPAFLLSQAHQPGFTAEVKDNVLTCNWGTAHLTADAATGRLQELTFTSADGKSVARATLTQGALATASARLRDDPVPNLYQPGHALGSWLRFAAQTGMLLPLVTRGTPKEHAAAAAIAGRLLTEDLLAVLDEPLNQAFTQDQMVVPIKTEDFDPFAEFLARVGIPLYAYGTWPRVLIRRRCLPAGSDPEEIRRLYEDPALGPLACLIIAESIDNPAVTAEFARLGRTRMTAQALAGDLAVLLGGEAPAPRFARGLLTHLRDLSQADMQALAAVLPADAALWFPALYRAMQLQKDAPLEKRLPELAEALFPGIQVMLDTRLQLLSPPVVPDRLPDLMITPPGK